MLIPAEMSHVHLSDQTVDTINVTVLGDRVELEMMDIDATTIGDLTIGLDTFDRMVVEVKRQRGVE